jgi:hypothetical protein
VEGAVQDGCFLAVPKHIAENGGKQITGWAIWEWPKVWIEAEFHCVYERPDGSWVDITPKAVAIPRILFLRDDTRFYRGRQVDNVRRQLIPDSDVRRYFEVLTLIHKEMNKGELATYHGPITITPILQRYFQERNQIMMMLKIRYGILTPEPFPDDGSEGPSV